MYEPPETISPSGKIRKLRLLLAIILPGGLGLVSESIAVFLERPDFLFHSSLVTLFAVPFCWLLFISALCRRYQGWSIVLFTFSYPVIQAFLISLLILLLTRFFL